MEGPAGKERGHLSQEMDNNKDCVVKAALPSVSPTSHPPSSFVNLPQVLVLSPTLHLASAQFAKSMRHWAGWVETIVEEEKEREGSRRGRRECE